MYVVKRPFRNYGKMLTPGSVVEPGDIKRFKSRIKEGRIVDVAENDISKWDAYLFSHYGTKIVVSKANVEQAVQPNVEPAVQPEKPKAAKAKATIKAK